MKVLKTETLHRDAEGVIGAERIIYVRENGTIGVKTRNDAPTKTQKHYKASTNMENIIKKWRDSNLDPRVRQGSGKFIDFRDLPKNFDEAFKTVMAVEQSFELLPSNVREKFDNDPAKLMKFVHDPKNKEAGIELGLFKKPEPPPRDLAKDIAAAIKESKEPEKK